MRRANNIADVNAEVNGFFEPSINALLNEPLMFAELSLIYRGQVDREGGAHVFAGAFGADRAAVQFDDVARDRQAQAETAVAFGRAVVNLAETLENVRQEFRRDALSRVADADLDI